MRQAQRRLVMNLVDHVGQSVDRGLAVWPATVESVASGNAPDGRDLVRVNWKGASVSAPYLDGLSLSPGQTVMVLYSPQSGLFILGRLVGAP